MMRTETRRQIELGLKIATGQLEGVRRMVANDAYCVDLMKQLSAVQAQLERVNRALLQNHLSTGHGEQKIEELMQALKYNGGLTGVAPDLTGVSALGGADACCSPTTTQKSTESLPR